MDMHIAYLNQKFKRNILFIKRREYSFYNYNYDICDIPNIKF